MLQKAQLLLLPILLSISLARAQSPATQPASGPASSGPRDEAPSDKRASRDVNIKKECGVLEDVFRHRAALQYLKAEKDAREAILKTIDPDSANAIRSIVDREENYTELDYHFTEKIKNCESRILERLRSDKFQGVADLLEVVKGKQYPASAAYANIVNTVELNFRYGIRNKLIGDDELVKEVGPKLTGEAARVEGTAGHTLEEIAKLLYKDTKPDDFPASWFDHSSEIISYEFGEIPVAKEFPKVDLATATRDQLIAIPGLEDEMADAIIKYRKRNNIVGVEELRLIEEIPARLTDPLASVCTVDRKKSASRTKKWTVMVYLNAANNLEPFGVKDMNEMEQIGSTGDVNVVVECARYHGKQAVKPNSQYLTNPYSDFSGAFYFGLDNSPGTRRYYILKDQDKARLRSVLVENVGETDAGRPEPLAEFGKWTAENFPAEHYMLVIWNHGAGWSGVSYDDNTHHGMDLPQVREALEGIATSLKKQNKDKIDVLDFDACLMATMEVGYELKDTVDYLVASQETEPGDGNPYSDILKFLTQYPESPSPVVAKAVAETYIRSYAPNGSQAEGSDQFWFGSETKSAIKLAKMDELRNGVEAVATILQKKPDILGEVTEDVVRDARKFGRLVDIQDFFIKLSQNQKSDKELKDAVARVVDLIGYPDDGKDRLVNEVVISRRSAGSVIWGFNGWAMPPRNLAPFVYQSRFAKTPLTGPDEKGNFTAKIKFSPMLKNPKTGKNEYVKEINYRFDDDSEKRTIKDFEICFYTTNFAPDSAVVGEGHMIGNNRSHGISLYFPAYLGFDKEYRRLRSSKDSVWMSLCEKFPMKKIEHPKEIAMLGMNHATKADRETLGKITVRDEFDKTTRRYDWTATAREDLKNLNYGFDSIRDPRPYGLDWLGMMEQYYSSGIVILDNHAGGELSAGEVFGPQRVAGPDGRHAQRLLRNGGRLLLGTSAATQTVWDTPLYKETLGLEYVMKWNRGYQFAVPNGKVVKADAKIAIETARKGESITIFKKRDDADGVEPFATLPDGQWIGAKIARKDPSTGKDFRAVILGFYLMDIQNADSRRAVLGEALEFLGAKKQEAAPKKPEAAKPEASAVPAVTPAGATATAANANGNREKK
ncbi:MAG: helix-hairpin-helix domain-containing protein [Planctomycetes bacterium]|nr:helix-hairpin-helix domain-containing protein [Planctomycetota bacterium]